MKYVAYYRVSTRQQGQSGLGLDAQRKAVADFIRSGELVAEFSEVKTGSDNSRPALLDAIAQAKACDATLLIAKLDRLSRDAGFILALRDSGVKFIACDMPEANSLTIGIMAVMAQHELELIKSRNKARADMRKVRTLANIKTDLLATGETFYDIDQAVAMEYRRLCQAQARKVTTEILPDARLASIASKKTASETCPEWIRASELARSLHASGMKLRAIADRLNASAYKTRHGKPFQAMTVKRLLARG
jgi:DNA invertase Pin-like site-specific DNA recombinase